jgi:hypothetical protein
VGVEVDERVDRDLQRVGERGQQGTGAAVAHEDQVAFDGRVVDGVGELADHPLVHGRGVDAHPQVEQHHRVAVRGERVGERPEGGGSEEGAVHQDRGGGKVDHGGNDVSLDRWTGGERS